MPPRRQVAKRARGTAADGGGVDDGSCALRWGCLLGPLDEGLLLQHLRPQMGAAELAALRLVSRDVRTALDGARSRVRLHLPMLQQALAVDRFRNAEAARQQVGGAKLAVPSASSSVMAALARWPACRQFEAVGPLSPGLVPLLVGVSLQAMGSLAAMQRVVEGLVEADGAETGLAGAAQLQFACEAALQGALGEEGLAQRLQQLSSARVLCIRQGPYTDGACAALTHMGVWAAYRPWPAAEPVLEAVAALLSDKRTAGKQHALVLTTTAMVQMARGNPLGAAKFAAMLPNYYFTQDLLLMLSTALATAGHADLATQLCGRPYSHGSFTSNLTATTQGVDVALSLAFVQHLSRGNADQACRCLLHSGTYSGALLTQQLLPALGIHEFTALQPNDPRCIMLQGQLAAGADVPHHSPYDVRMLAQLLATGLLHGGGHALPAGVPQPTPDEFSAWPPPYKYSNQQLRFKDAWAERLLDLFGASDAAVMQPPGGAAGRRYRPWPEMLAAVARLAGAGGPPERLAALRVLAQPPDPAEALAFVRTLLAAAPCMGGISSTSRPVLLLMVHQLAEAGLVGAATQVIRMGEQPGGMTAHRYFPVCQLADAWLMVVEAALRSSAGSGRSQGSRSLQPDVALQAGRVLAHTLQLPEAPSEPDARHVRALHACLVSCLARRRLQLADADMAAMLRAALLPCREDVDGTQADVVENILQRSVQLFTAVEPFGFCRELLELLAQHAAAMAGLAPFPLSWSILAPLLAVECMDLGVAGGGVGLLQATLGAIPQAEPRHFCTTMHALVMVWDEIWGDIPMHGTSQRQRVRYLAQLMQQHGALLFAGCEGGCADVDSCRMRAAVLALARYKAPASDQLLCALASSLEPGPARLPRLQAMLRTLADAEANSGTTVSTPSASLPPGTYGRLVLSLWPRSSPPAQLAEAEEALVSVFEDALDKGKAEASATAKMGSEMGIHTSQHASLLRWLRMMEIAAAALPEGAAARSTAAGITATCRQEWEALMAAGENGSHAGGVGREG